MAHAISDETDDESLPAASPFGDLTAFKIDVLCAIPRADDHPSADVTYGLAIKEYLINRRDGEVNHGRLYPNLDQLVEQGFVSKTPIDDRTNGYELTSAGEERLFAVLSEAHDALDASGE